MSSNLPQIEGDDADRGTSALALVWVECAIAILVVAFRIWSRYSIKNLGADDWMMLFTLVILGVYSAFVTHYALLGGFRHLGFLSESGADIKRIALINYILQFVATFSYAPAKTSVALLVLRIIGPKNQRKNGGWRRWLIIGMLALVWGATISSCIMIFLQCKPVAAVWDYNYPGRDAACWEPNVFTNYAFFVSSVNVWSDAVLAAIPASLIWKLNMDLKRRVTLSILLGLGVLAAICGIVKTVYLKDLTATKDLTWETYNLIMWAGSELFVLIFCGSLVTLKPLWDRMTGSMKTRGSSGVTSYYGGKASNISDKVTLQHSTQVSRQPVSITKGNTPDSSVPEGSIRATTDIDVHRSGELNTV